MPEYVLMDKETGDLYVGWEAMAHSIYGRIMSISNGSTVWLGWERTIDKLFENLGEL